VLSSKEKKRLRYKSPGDPLKLEAGFRPLGQGYRKPSVHRQGPLCMLSGVIRAADMKGGYTRIAVLPFLCRPSLGHLVFATNRGKMTQRIDIMMNGDLVWTEGVKLQGYISLDGIHFNVDDPYAQRLNMGLQEMAKANLDKALLAAQQLSQLRPLVLGQRWRPWQAQGSTVKVGIVKQVTVCQGDYLKLSCTGKDILNIRSAIFGRTNTKQCPKEGGMNNLRCRNDVMAKLVKPCHTKSRCSVLVGPAALGEPCSDTQKYLSVSYSCDTPSEITDISALQKAPRPLYTFPQFTRVGPLCFMSGAAQLQLGTLKEAFQVAVFSEDCQPPGRLSFTMIPNRYKSFRVDALPTGALKYITGADTDKDATVSFNNVVYFAKNNPSQPILVNIGWSNYGTEFAPAAYVKFGDICVLSGTVRVENIESWSSDLIGLLPTECRPEGGTLIFNANHGSIIHQIEITPNGHIMNIAGKKKVVQISLDGIVFFTGNVKDLRKKLRLVNGWKPYGGGYRVPEYFKQGDICALGGMLLPLDIKANTITMLPAECRPTSTLVFPVNRGESSEIITVSPNGAVTWKDGAPSSGWLPLDGIQYVVQPNFVAAI